MGRLKEAAYPAAGSVESYRKNRKRIPHAKLVKHWENWVAFSRDGTCVIASAKTPEKLAKRIASAGKKADDVVLEYLESDSTVLGGVELL
jgi:hypothetical protein